MAFTRKAKNTGTLLCPCGAKWKAKELENYGTPKTKYCSICRRAQADMTDLEA